MPEDRIPLDQNQQEQKRGKVQSEISAFSGTESQDRTTGTDPLQRTVSRNISRLRREKGLTQRQLAFLWKARWLIPYPMFTLRTQESQRETTNAFP